MKLRNAHTKCHIPIKDKWTVHGVWPSNRNYRQQTQCLGDERFETGQLQSIMDDMKTRWFSVTTGNDQKFWRHEWDKHGRCGHNVRGLDTMLNYFKKGLIWNKQYDVAAILAQHNIHPDNNVLMPVSSISNAIKSTIGAQPKIRCLKDEYLSEIYLCFDDNLNIMDCYGQPNCKKDIFYLETWEDVPKYPTSTHKPHSTSTVEPHPSTSTPEPHPSTSTLEPHPSTSTPEPHPSTSTVEPSKSTTVGGNLMIILIGIMCAHMFIKIP